MVRLVSARLRPSRALLKRCRDLYGPGTVATLLRAADDKEAVDGLARLLDEAMTKHTKPDGRLDLRDVAASVLARMRENQMAIAPEARVHEPRSA